VNNFQEKNPLNSTKRKKKT